MSKTVTLFWNHICILHNKEKQHMEQVRRALREHHINLEIRYFGMGYPEHMAEYLARQDAELPDLIVSADLEVFECAPIFAKLGCGHACASWLPLRNQEPTRVAMRRHDLLPVVAIPLVLYGKKNHPAHEAGADCPANMAQSDIPALADTMRLALGGIDNSAGKTIAKILIERYGEAAARRVLSAAEVCPMPISAFQAVRGGAADIALVPSLYAMRADNVSTYQYLPSEGPWLLPSYFWASTRMDEALARTVAGAIFDAELMDFYRTSGNLIGCIDRGRAQSTYEHVKPCAALSQSFIESFAPERFYDLYCSAIPQAKRLL